MCGTTYTEAYEKLIGVNGGADKYYYFIVKTIDDKYELHYWHQEVGTTSNPQSLSYDEIVIEAFKAAKKIASSDDGRTWTAVTSGTDTTVAYGPTIESATFIRGKITGRATNTTTIGSLNVSNGSIIR